ncbi:MAG TPA: orotidine-5'-phosphate decarboxylase [Thermoanaerobaculia bacterium]|jgi:orotidine-5'-phosphate decarboxylase|nr:orotidine-5'-phosphate decarboxylase [Thermoanaerobaculia bacterium]
MAFEDSKHPESGDPIYLSTKTIPPEERLIFALDVPTVEEARGLVLTLKEAVQFYKVGLELFLAGGASFELIDWLVGQDKKVFLDLKLYDIPETVARAVRALRERPVTFLTVHGDGAILEAAGREKGDLKILAVTVLTSLDRAGLRELGFAGEVSDLVLARARRAQETGCDGVIASGQEAKALRDHLGRDLLIVTPGIRPSGNRPADDQKRVVTVEEALRGGADHIVVGRPIRDAADPYEAALQIQGTIEGLFLSG